MRSLHTALILVALSVSTGAQAQSRQGGPRGPAPAHPTAPAPPTAPAHPTAPPPAHPTRPAPRTVAPPILYPFSPLMTPPAGGLTPLVPSNPAYRPNPRYPRGGYGNSGYGNSGYGSYYVGSDYADSTTMAPGNVDVMPRASGALRLAVIPTSAQVFVDGFYVGTVDDVNAKRELQLEPGPHRVEFRASYYQPLAVDVQIAPNETVTYRATMDTVRPAAPSASAQGRAAGAGSDKMYMIPNCYLGNVPPRADRLPAGCDVNRVQVLGAK